MFSRALSSRPEYEPVPSVRCRGPESDRCPFQRWSRRITACTLCARPRRVKLREQGHGHRPTLESCARTVTPSRAPKSPVRRARRHCALPRCQRPHRSDGQAPKSRNTLRRGLDLGRARATGASPPGSEKPFFEGSNHPDDRAASAASERYTPELRRALARISRSARTELYLPYLIRAIVQTPKSLSSGSIQ